MTFARMPNEAGLILGENYKEWVDHWNTSDLRNQRLSLFHRGASETFRDPNQKDTNRQSPQSDHPAGLMGHFREGA